MRSPGTEYQNIRNSTLKCCIGAWLVVVVFRSMMNVLSLDLVLVTVLIYLSIDKAV